MTRILAMALIVLAVAGAARAATDSPAAALIEAARAGDVAALRRLLAAGADPDGFDGGRNTGLIYAARDGRTAIARALINAGATVDWIDGEGVTPLILAAFRGHGDIVRLLLCHRAARGPRDRWGRNALDYARRRGAGDAIAAMLDGSIAPDCGKASRTPVNSFELVQYCSYKASAPIFGRSDFNGPPGCPEEAPRWTPCFANTSRS